MDNTELCKIWLKTISVDAEESNGSCNNTTLLPGTVERKGKVEVTTVIKCQDDHWWRQLGILHWQGHHRDKKKKK